jgi:hypothetical protein
MTQSMNKPIRAALTTLGILVLGAAISSNAYARCADTLSAPIKSQHVSLLRPASFRLGIESQAVPAGADIIGMWQFQFVARNSAPIPDGTVIDAGYVQWHGDGTEITNSSRPPATGNVCLGVWKMIGPSSYRLNHRALNFDSNGNLIGPVAIREEVIVDRKGVRYTGTFTIDLFDNQGHTIGHVEGEVSAQRIPVD